ncbi:hypothetical protein CEUSTIGMA_g7034.t1 [Chlamydomonas eustigma]|uniref:Sulfotransferase n=1 Tax=Chlamydomonas eustigma TaxID=1157962 RepID=A0A250X934_9CHLO|nr:hypothetical protein CEUSTIGMA_g7034.t1 [Chlamydomonas eustigma]|eukprot:GAX79593.1 hypothetical protein CEUSTIGMA_g7034.t1 [Chlamydomonas eustigma]
MAFLIGAQKSGTTFLFDQLVARHPHIIGRTWNDTGTPFMKKEAHFFSRVPLLEKDFLEYTSSFAASGDINSQNFTFLDATPDYMQIASAPCRISSLVPEAKIIVVLRDPVLRAFSHWNMNQKLQLRPLVKKFDEEVRIEIEGLRKNGCSFESDAFTATESHKDSSYSRTGSSWNKCFKCKFECGLYSAGDKKDHSKDSPLRRKSVEMSCSESLFSIHGIVRRGFHAEQLHWWLQHLRPDQFLILQYEQLKLSANETLERVVKHLGLDPSLISKDPLKSLQEKPSVYASTKWELPTGGWSIPADNATKQKCMQTFKYLRNFYAPANDRLEQLLNSLGMA